MAIARFQLFRVSTGLVTWRFMAPNNRELAWAGVPGADEWDARALVIDLRRRLPESRSSVFQDSAGRWHWDVRLADAVAAVSSRGYLRRVECDIPRTQFLLSAAEAAVSDTVASYRTHTRQIVLPSPRQLVTEAPAAR